MAPDSSFPRVGEKRCPLHSGRIYDYFQNRKRLTSILLGKFNDLGISMKHSHPVAPISHDERATVLRQLTNEARRVVNAMARFSLQASPDDEKAFLSVPGATTEPVPRVTSERVLATIKARRLRARFFSENLFADPAWDILLDLLQAEVLQVRVSVSSLCGAAAVPATTALRWIKTLTDRGLIVRRADPFDGRRVFVELSPNASDAMHRYFHANDALQRDE